MSKRLLKPLDKNIAGIISASLYLFGGARAQYYLIQILEKVNAINIKLHKIMVTQVDKKFDENGTSTDEISVTFLKKFSESFAEFLNI